MNMHAFKLGGRARLSGMTKDENPIRKMREMGMPGVTDYEIDGWDSGWEAVDALVESPVEEA